MNLGQGIMVAEARERFGYTLYDFDKDGVYELVIGGLAVDYYSEKHIYITGIVALDGDGYKIVAAGWSRSDLEYVGGGYFVNSGSGGAALHYDAVFKYDGVSKELATVGMLVTEYVDSDAEIKPNYSYFKEADDAYSSFPAYGSETAVCFDDEATAKFEEDLKVANSQTNELMDANWTIVECA